MKICIFSDIHGNLEALKKMLAYEIETVEVVIFAGDIFGYFYEQIEIIQNLICIPKLLAVRGNHDDNYLTNKDRDSMINRYGSSYDLLLPPRQKAFLASMPSFLETTIAGKKFGIFHGGPNEHMTQRIYPDTEICLEAMQNKYDYIVLGHTHHRFIKKVGSTWIINPGSLGQPRDGRGFGYCILDIDNHSCQFKTVDVDVEKLLSQVQKRDAGRLVFEYLTQKHGR